MTSKTVFVPISFEAKSWLARVVDAGASSTAAVISAALCMVASRDIAAIAPMGIADEVAVDVDEALLKLLGTDKRSLGGAIAAAALRISVQDVLLELQRSRETDKADATYRRCVRALGLEPRPSQELFVDELAGALIERADAIVVAMASTGSGKTLAASTAIVDTLARPQTRVLVAVPTLAVGLQWGRLLQGLAREGLLPGVTGIWGRSQYLHMGQLDSALAARIAAVQGDVVPGFAGTVAGLVDRAPDLAGSLDTEDIAETSTVAELQAGALEEASSARLVLTSHAMLAQIRSLGRFDLVVVDEGHLLRTSLDSLQTASCEVTEADAWPVREALRLWRSLRLFHSYGQCTDWPGGFEGLKTWARHAQGSALGALARTLALSLDEGATLHASTSVDGAQLLTGRRRRAVEPLLADIWNSGDQFVVLSGSLRITRPTTVLDKRGICGWCGIPADRAVIVEGESDDWIHRQTDLRFVPCGIPTGSDEAYVDWLDRCAEQLVDIAKSADGGMLVLCTAYRDIEALRERVGALQARLLVQRVGDKVGYLLQDFLSKPRGIWLATGAAWTGIDVGGDESAVTDLVIPRLPFDPSWTDDEVIAGISKSSILSQWKLRQGVGRAVRKPSYENPRRVWILDDRTSLDRRASPQQRALLGVLQGMRPAHAVDFGLLTRA